MSSYETFWTLFKLALWQVCVSVYVSTQASHSNQTRPCHFKLNDVSIGVSSECRARMSQARVLILVVAVVVGASKLI